MDRNKESVCREAEGKVTEKPALCVVSQVGVQ